MLNELPNVTVEIRRISRGAKLTNTNDSRSERSIPCNICDGMINPGDKFITVDKGTHYRVCSRCVGALYRVLSGKEG